MRTDNSSLPDKQELDTILGREASRPLPKDKTTVHYVDYAAILALLRHLDVPETVFTVNDNIAKILRNAVELLDAVVAKLQCGSLDDTTVTLLHAAYAYLSAQDPPAKSDLIFVFGSGTPYRALKAAELYHSAIAPLIMVSGRGPIYSHDPTTEASRYRAILVENGVPKTAIITEDKAITIFDNVCRSLNILDERGLSPTHITLVNSPYSQRRGWAVFNKHVPMNVHLHRVNSDSSPAYAADQWYRQERTLRVVLSEFIKLRASEMYNTA